MASESAASGLFGSPEIFASYSRRLASLAGKHLSDRIRTRVDGEDIAQSALRTFFRRYAGGEFQIDSSTELWTLLAHMTVRKAQAHARHHVAQKRNPTAEVAVCDSGNRSAEPTAEDVVMVEDLVDNMLTGLPEKHGEMLGLLLEGRSRTDVAQEIGVSRMTVHRVLEVLKERIAAQLR